MDAATSHTSEDVSAMCQVEKIDVKVIHPGLTPLLQFLDTHTNKSFKGALKDSWEAWLDEGEVQYTNSGNRKGV